MQEEPTQPTQQDKLGMLIRLNLASIRFEQAKTRGERDQAEQDFQLAQEWFKLHNIAIHQNEQQIWQLEA